MKRPAVFFDRDNTLIVSDGYLGDPEGVILIDGAADAVARARQLGYATVVFTNQSGVARGMFTEEKVHAVNARLDEMLQDQNTHAVIDRHEYCPFHPEGSIEAYRKDSDLRKPKPGMILQAAERLALDLSRSWVIGDAPRDIEAGHAAGCRTILFTDSKLVRSPAAMARSPVEPDYVADSLHAALAIIEMQTRSEIPAILDSTPETPTAAAVAPIANTPTDAAPLAAAEAAIAESPEVTTEEPMILAASPAAPIATSPSLGAPVNSVSAGPNDAAALMERIESVAKQILGEVRRGHEQQHLDFSISKLMAGIVQVIALAALFVGWMRGSPDIVVVLLLALFLQTLTIALLIMGRQH
jgi:D-glycero-D-manno-heptose 1,7-bisphosphate phosphatase